LIGGHNTRLGNRNDVLIQKQYMQDIMTFTEEIMNDPKKFVLEHGQQLSLNDQRCQEELPVSNLLNAAITRDTRLI
jgi:hypothetical protein